MPRQLKLFLQRWLICAVAVLVAVYVSRGGLGYDTPLALVAAALLLGVLNAVLRPVLLFFALPLLVFTLGLFLLVVNALLLYLVGFLLQPHFYVKDFGSAFWGALVISIVSLILNTLTGTGRSRVVVQRPRPPPRDGGNGPVIDV